VVSALLIGAAFPRAAGVPRRALRLALYAIVAGAFWGACFLPATPPGLSFLALGPLLLLSRASVTQARGALVLGWLHGIVAWWVQVPWIAATIHRHGGLPAWVALLLLLLLCAYLGAYHAAFAWVSHRLSRSASLAAVFGAPAAWVSLEWLRGVLFTGFPWNLAGYTLADVPGALGLAAVVGSHGLSYLVVVVNASWAVAVVERRARALAGLLFAGALVGSGVLLDRDAAGDEAVAPTLEVSLVQPATAILTDPGSPQVERDYARLLSLSRCPEAGALVVWPESAAWPYSWQGEERLRSDLQGLAARGCSVLFNSTIWDGPAIYNSALLLAPDGTMQRYDKNQLVPFGEYVPLGELLPFVRQLARAAGSYDAAEEARLLDWSGERLGLSICFEITMPAQVALRVRRGATLLVTLTNDAWFGDTSAPWQHLAAARLRAAENRRPVLRAAISGISAVIDHRGRIVERLLVGEAGVIEAEVAGRRESTPYSRAPWAVPAACAAAALWLVVRSTRREHDRERDTAAARSDEDAARDAPGVSLTGASSSGS
jgi:apolipoprotein N-acyltransferase